MPDAIVAAAVCLGCALGVAYSIWGARYCRRIWRRTGRWPNPWSGSYWDDLFSGKLDDR